MSAPMLPRTLMIVGALVIAPVLTAMPAMANTALAPLEPGAVSAPVIDEDAEAATTLAVSVSPRPKARRAVVIPTARWGDKRKDWSMTVLASLRSHAAILPQIEPADIGTWCPAYTQSSLQEREAFWLGLVSALVKHESTYRPTAVGGGGLWYGLMQILPSTARLYGCKARSGDALKDPNLNLSCGLRIMARTVARDQVVSQNMRGVAADWGPFHSRKKREDMIAWTRAQPYCAGLPRSPRPIARPDTLNVQRLMAEGTSLRPVARFEAPPAQFDETGTVIAENGAIRRPTDGVIATSGSLLAETTTMVE